MAHILQYTLSLQDKISGPLSKIGIANSKQLEIWGKVQQRVAGAADTMKKCGVSIGSLRERVAALRAEKEWIPAGNRQALKVTNREIDSLERKIRKLENTSGRGMLGQWFNNLKTSIPFIGMVTNPLVMMAAAIYKVTNYLKESQSAWYKQIESESKLAAVMRNTMGAQKDEVDSILKLASAQQKLGVIGDEVQLAGAQELATYLTKKNNLERLLPVMNDMLAQQYGYNATQEQAVTIASMMGKVMDGQVGALSRYGYKFDAVQEKILRYGNEAHRTATLVDVVTSAVGGVNAALADTPEGKLKQHANDLGDIQERFGKMVVQVKAAMIPLFEWFRDALDSVASWLERNSASVSKTMNFIAKAFRGAFAIIGKVIGGAIKIIGWWITKLQEGNMPVVILTSLLGSFAVALGVARLAQMKLNLAMLANPITWIVVGVIALIAVIAYVCYKIEGWGSLWEGTVNFMKYSFKSFTSTIALEFEAVVHGIMMGLDYIKIGWYKFWEAIGIGDSSENQAMLAQLNADIDRRKQSVVDRFGQAGDYAVKAQQALAGIDVKWNSEKSLSDITGGLKKSLGIDAAGIPGMAPIGGLGDGLDGDGFGGKGGGSSEVTGAATGGTRNSTINITVEKLVETIVFGGGYDENEGDFKQRVESALLQVLYAAQTAQ